MMKQTGLTPSFYTVTMDLVLQVTMMMILVIVITLMVPTQIPTLAPAQIPTLTPTQIPTLTPTPMTPPPTLMILPPTLMILPPPPPPMILPPPPTPMTSMALKPVPMEIRKTNISNSGRTLLRSLLLLKSATSVMIQQRLPWPLSLLRMRIKFVYLHLPLMLQRKKFLLIVVFEDRWGEDLLTLGGRGQRE